MNGERQDRFGRWIGISLATNTAHKQPSDRVWQRIVNQLTVNSTRKKATRPLEKRQFTRRAG